MKTKKTSIKDNILSTHLINGSHDFKSVGGLLVSGIVSTFGVYSLILPFFTDKGVVNSSSLTMTLIAFVVLLIIVDTIKRGSLTKYFNSLLKRKILKTSSKKGYLVVSIFTLLFMVLLDSLGAYATAEKGANLYSQFKTNSSTEYQILQQNAESGKAIANNYILELNAWRESKKEAHNNCIDEWKGWKAKYKAKCKREWNNANPMPKQTTDGQIKIDDYKSIKNDNHGFLDQWLFTILFVLLGGITLLMQYLTIAKIHDDKNDIEDSLTDDRIEFIKDDISEHEAIQAEHEQAVAKVIVDSTKRQKGLDKDFKEVGEAIAITHKQKRNETRAKTVMRIANNDYVPHEKSKAGYVSNPFANKPNKSNDLTFSDLLRLSHPIYKNKGTPKVIKQLSKNKNDGYSLQTPYSGEGTIKLSLEDLHKWIKTEQFIVSNDNGSLYFGSYDMKPFNKWVTSIFGTEHLLEEENKTQSVKRSHKQPLNETKKTEPLNGEQENTSLNKQPLNESVITDRKETEPLNGVVKRMDLKNYSHGDLELIDLLWKQSTVKRNDQLETRDNIIKVIGDNKNNTLRLRNLYKKLLADEYIYKRVGYFAKVELS